MATLERFMRYNIKDRFHAKIVIPENDIRVSVNHAARQSLVVNKLIDREDGNMGIMVYRAILSTLP